MLIYKQIHNRKTRKNNIIKIYIKEEQKIENSATINASAVSKSNITNNTTTIIENEESSNLLSGVITLGILGGSYWGYKKS